jgi:hypothetical protein
VPRGPDEAPPYVAAVAQWTDEKRGGERREKSIGLRALMAANPRLVADTAAANLVRTARFALQLHETPAQGSNAGNRKVIAARLPQVQGWWRHSWADAIDSVASPPPRMTASLGREGASSDIGLGGIGLGGLGGSQQAKQPHGQSSPTGGGARANARVKRKPASPPQGSPQTALRAFEALPPDILGEIGGYATPWDVEAIAEQLPGVGERIREAEARPRQSCGVRMREAIEAQVQKFEEKKEADVGGGGGGGGEDENDSQTPGGVAVTRRCESGCERVGEWLFDRSAPGKGLEFAFGVVPERRASLDSVAGVDATVFPNSLYLAPRAATNLLRIGRGRTLHYVERAASLPRFLALVSSVCGRRIATARVYGATETIWDIGPTTTATRVHAVCNLNASVNIFPTSGPSGPWRDLAQRLMCAVAAVYCDALVVDVAGRPRTAPGRLADYDTARFLVHAWRRALSPDLPVWVRTPSHPPKPKDAAAALGIREESVLPLEEPLLRRQR